MGVCISDDRELGNDWGDIRLDMRLEIQLIPTSNYVLLYKHTNNDIFDHFSKISDHFPKISEILQSFLKATRMLPIIF